MSSVPWRKCTMVFPHCQKKRRNQRQRNSICENTTIYAQPMLLSTLPLKLPMASTSMATRRRSLPICSSFIHRRSEKISRSSKAQLSFRRERPFRRYVEGLRIFALPARSRCSYSTVMRPASSAVSWPMRAGSRPEMRVKALAKSSASSSGNATSSPPLVCGSHSSAMTALSFAPCGR